MIGRWNVEINFADGNKRSLRFDAHDDGKGILSCCSIHDVEAGGGRQTFGSEVDFRETKTR